ncbi:uncharacterized protein LOC135828324 [Sycon ciliatum]|uniref:uncharacterized protein LOC135828324 n=1 Tax=Sycon ciliatum TaxID=27933 RepID=UPI0031F6C7CB
MLTRRMSLGQCCASFLLAVLTAALLRTPVAVIAVPVTPAQDVLWQDNSLAPAVSDGENVEFVNASLEHTMLRGRCEVLCSTSLRNLSAEERQNCSEMCDAGFENATALCSGLGTCGYGSKYICQEVCKLLTGTNTYVPINDTRTAKAGLSYANSTSYREIQLTYSLPGVSNTSLFLAVLTPVSQLGLPDGRPRLSLVQSNNMTFSTAQLLPSTSYRLTVSLLSDGPDLLYTTHSYFTIDEFMDAIPALNITSNAIPASISNSVRLFLRLSALPGFDQSLLTRFGISMTSEMPLCTGNDTAPLHAFLTEGTVAINVPDVFQESRHFHLLYGCAYDFKVTNRLKTAEGKSVGHPSFRVRTGNLNREIGPVINLVSKRKRVNGVSSLELTFKLPHTVHPSVIRQIRADFFLLHDAIPSFTVFQDIPIGISSSDKIDISHLVDANRCYNITMYAIPFYETPMYGRPTELQVCVPIGIAPLPPPVVPPVPQQFQNLYRLQARHVETTIAVDFPTIDLNWTQIGAIQATEFRVGLKSVQTSQYGPETRCLSNPGVFEASVDMNLSTASIPYVFSKEVFPARPFPAYGCDFQVQLAYKVPGFDGWVPLSPIRVSSPYYSISAPKVRVGPPEYIGRPDGNATVILRWLPPVTLPMNFIYAFSVYLTRVDNFPVFSQPYNVLLNATDTHDTKYIVQLPWNIYSLELGHSYTFTIYTAVYKRPVYQRSNRAVYSGIGIQTVIDLPALPTSPTPPHTEVLTSPTVQTATEANANVIIGITAPVGVIVIGIAMYTWVRFNNKSKLKMNSLRKRATINDDAAARNLYQQNGGLEGIHVTTTNFNWHGETKDEWEVDPDMVTCVGELGEGAFGKVFKAELKNGGGRKALGEGEENKDLQLQDTVQIVAVKQLKLDYGIQDLDLFKSEIELMKNVGSHPNVLRMVGCVVQTEKIMLLTEFAEFNNLHSFLVTAKEKNRLPGEKDAYYNDGTEGVPTVQINEYHTLGQVDLLSFGHQIAAGMHHLQTMKIVHRDLAARNVLVGGGKILKISDFGLAKDVYLNEEYVQKTKGKLPYKWMSIEAIRDRRYTSASDMWAYGITMWECMTLGSHPYPTLSNEDLLEFLLKGKRLSRPDGIDQDVFDAVAQCWRENPDERPQFSDMANDFAQRYQVKCHRTYIDIG